MRKILAAAGLCVGFLLFIGSAAADMPSGWSLDVTPRLWYMIVNPTPYSNSQTIQQTNETAMFPMYGLSVRIEPAGLAGSDFLFTALRGSDSVEGRSVTSFGVSAQHRTDATRTDIELLYRTRVPKSDSHWFVGARWVLLEENSTVGSGLTYPASTTNRLSERNNFYLAEGGMSFTTPIDAIGRHLLFGNFTGGVGYQDHKVTNRQSPNSPDRSGIVPFMDVNIGYEYVLAPRASFHMRYRSFILHEKYRDEIVVLHGPEIGITFRF